MGNVLVILNRMRGLLRSLRMYYWPPGQNKRIDAFYAQLIEPGALCFDVGAHVGNRSLCFHRLGARVVAVEPQPDFARFLSWLFKGKQRLVLERVAIGASEGEIDLYLSSATPTVTSASQEFVRETPAIESFSAVVWDRSIKVEAMTLSSLAARHGQPDFIKLDIEGLEIAALAGLEAPPRLLSFEFLAARPKDTLACLDRLDELGSWHFNISRGEDLSMLWPEWQQRLVLEQWLQTHAGQDFSGDIYAKLASPDGR